MGNMIQMIVNCSCCPSKPIYPDPYQFEFDPRSTNLTNSTLFQSNFVRTSRYTLFTFLPKALLLQFKRLANVYFLVVAILLSIAIISPLNPLTAWAPLIIVIGISMARQGFEDYQRYKSDKEMNFDTSTKVLRNGSFTQMQWSQVLVGDICQIYAEEMFPADLILLSSSSENGVAFIETASLDGQKNLKPRNSLQKTSLFNSEDKIIDFKGKFEGDSPKSDLHRFNAKISFNENQNVIINGDKQLLYRGTRLKNTKFIFGLVIYTGKNSKIILNSESSSEKMSQIEIKVNYILGIILIIQTVLCLLCAITYGLYRSTYQQTYSYLDWPAYGIPLDSFLIFLTYFVLLNTMIPISLIVSIEIVKLFQKYFIEKDHLMYSELRKKYVTVKTSSLNEELGQIQYVFTDKTGTLTMNLMEFKIAAIGSQLYGDLDLIYDKPNNNRQQHQGFKDDTLEKLLSKGVGDMVLRDQIVVNYREGGEALKFTKIRQLAEEYFIALGLAHQVVVEPDKDGTPMYQGPSPDQIALVKTAKALGYEFTKSNQFQTFLKIKDKEKKYDVLQLFPFTSERKRMSIIVRDPKDKKIKMYTKGADSTIIERLSPHQKLNLDQELNSFSIVGLRTLLISMRVISEQEYSQFQKQLSALPQENNQALYDHLKDQIERDLYIIGATAVLDRLQEDVPQTIRDLIRANIKVWMLTGDKMETAENIAKSCKLIQPHFQILKFKPDEFYQQHKGTYKTPQDQELVLDCLRQMVVTSQKLTEDGIPKALLISHDSLNLILGNNQKEIELANLAKNCEAVVCCRLQPQQKAELVKVVRTHLNKITLAIGDGANDVPMIKSAHIGIGLFGEEGMSAVQASDYALPQFRMLWRLLFVHGRWNYIRISQMILYFFYKNMLFTLPQFIAAFYNGFSGQTVFDDIYITLYNLIFTAIPLLIRAVFEQDVNYVFKQPENLNADEPLPTVTSLIKQTDYLPPKYVFNKYFYRLFPKIYFIGQQNCIFNYKNYVMWMIQGAVQALLISFVCFYVIGAISLNSTGISSDYWIVGLTIYSSIILVVTFKLASHTRFLSVILIFSMLFLSLGLYVGYMWLSNFALSFNIQGTTLTAWTSIETYLVVLFCVVVVLFVDGVVVFMDFRKGGYASKMRLVVQNEQMNNRQYFDDISLTITEGLTEAEKK